MDITYRNKQFIIDGEPRVLLFAEFHYYRTSRVKWQEKIDLIKESGCHGIATYIPWILHEEKQGDFDFTGKYNDRHDLVGFMQLVEDNDLYFIARPGPFIMAEMKNDGVPFWVYETYPEVVPTSWFGEKARTVTLDYLAPNFLKASKAYYEQVIPLIAKHQYPEGNTLAIQLDNEVGMLSWVSNNPDLTDNLLKDFYQFLASTYNDELSDRYAFAKTYNETFSKHVRFPEESYYHKLHVDLGEYNRKRFESYIETLADYATSFGFDKGLFIVNIHGCSAGRGLRYPIGISQLYKSYRNKDRIISGSDHYLTSVDVPHFTDAYMVNALTDASNGKEQPLTSLEFSGGDGNYGNNYGTRYPTSRLDFMTRIFVAMGNRVLNYYTFVGGTNYRFNHSLNDGNDRIASTGEEHGFAAPISPNGEKSYTWDRMQEVMHLVKNHETHLATMKLVTDNLTYVFDPDYYMTEYHTPNLPRVIHDNLSKHRNGGIWDNLIKGLLLLNYHFKAINIKDDELEAGNTLLLPSARFMSKESQTKVVEHLKRGGNMILYGEIPLYDLEHVPCTIMKDYLEITNIELFESRGYRFRTSIIAQHLAEGRAELHRNYHQTFETHHEQDVFFKVYHNNKTCGAHITKGSSQSLVITTPYRPDLELLKRFMDTLGVHRSMYHDYELYHGIMMLKTRNDNNEEYNHLINLDDFDKEFTLFDGEKQTIYLEANKALMLPKNLQVSEDLIILSSTLEVLKYTADKLIIGLSGATGVITLKTTKTVQSDDPFVTITTNGDVTTITKTKRLFNEKSITINLE